MHKEEKEQQYYRRCQWVTNVPGKKSNKFNIGSTIDIPSIKLRKTENRTVLCDHVLTP